MKKYEFSVKLSKVDSAPTTAVSLASENVQVQELTLAEIQKKFTVFGWATLHKTGNELVVGRTRILREGQIIVELTLEITQDFYWKLYVHHKLFEVASSDVFPNQLTVLNINKFVENLNKCNICIGNNDFENVVRNTLEKNTDLVFSDKNNEEKAVLETIDMKDIRSVATIRVINCTIFVFGHFRYRKILSAMASKLKENDVSFNKFTPHVKLTKEQLNLKTKYYAQEIRQLRASNKMLLERIKSVIDEERMLLESDINDICCKAINQEKYLDNLDPDSPQALLWEEQKRYNSVKRKNSMKWHPVMIRWCLSIYLKSPGNGIFEFVICTILFFPACCSKVAVGGARVNFIISRVQFMVQMCL